MINNIKIPKIYELNFIRENIYNFEQFKILFYNYELILKKNYLFIDVNLSCNLIEDDLIFKILNFKIANYKINLCALNLSYNRITKNGLIYLFNFLSACPNFNNLICEYNLFNEDEFYYCLLNSPLPNELKNKFTYHNW